MTWKNRVLVVMVMVVMVEVAFIAYDVPARVNDLVNSYLGFQQSDVWESTAESFARRKWLAAYLDERALAVEEVNCRKVLDGDPEELVKANASEARNLSLPTNSQVLRLAGNCSSLVRHYGFLQDPLTRLEQRFPIAFSILTFKEAGQVVDLLRAIYRPQNWYCLHVDRKSGSDFRQALEAVAGCFPNVFLTRRSVAVYWGTFSVLQPELMCMRELWGRARWRYFINLTGQEFPLRTNYELVRILSAFQGANDIAAVIPNAATIRRWGQFLPAPHNITVYKGSVHIVASRGFVDYVLHSPKALDFQRWCQRTRVPDEHFFNSLNHNPHLRVPGGSTGKILNIGGGRRVLSPSIARYKNWVPLFPCPGHKVRHAICILNVLDLPRLRTRRELFANKFYADYSRLALRCLAEELHNRTREQALGRSDFDVTFYEQLPHVRNRLRM